MIPYTLLSEPLPVVAQRPVSPWLHGNECATAETRRAHFIVGVAGGVGHADVRQHAVGDKPDLEPVAGLTGGVLDGSAIGVSPKAVRASVNLEQEAGTGRAAVAHVIVNEEEPGGVDLIGCEFLEAFARVREVAVAIIAVVVSNVDPATPQVGGRLQDEVTGARVASTQRLRHWGLGGGRRRGRRCNGRCHADHGEYDADGCDCCYGTHPLERIARGQLSHVSPSLRGWCDARTLYGPFPSFGSRLVTQRLVLWLSANILIIFV
jgi:hypothetical protein